MRLNFYLINQDKVNNGKSWIHSIHSACLALLIIALLFSGYSWSVSPVTGQAKTPDEGQRHASNHNEQTATFPSPVNLNVCEKPAATSTQGNEAGNQEWPEPMTVFTLLLVIVGLGQAFFLWRTVNATKIAANAAKESADAAKTASDALPLVERAYVFISDAVCPLPEEHMFEEESIFKIEYSFKNHGRTPAILKDWRFDARYIPSCCPGEPSWGKELTGTTVIGSDKSSVVLSKSLNYFVWTWP